MDPERQNNDANLIPTQLSYTCIYTSNVLKQDCLLEVSFAGGAEHTGLPVRGGSFQRLSRSTLNRALPAVGWNYPTVSQVYQIAATGQHKSAV